MIPRTKFGDCSNPECGKKETECVKVGKELFCINCRNKQKINKQLSKGQVRSIASKIYKLQDRQEAERSYLIHDLDDIVSKYIRIRESDKYGYVSCYTCGLNDSWTKMDCGHYISRKFMGLRWDVRNLKPQCKKCNQFMDGNISIYESNLELETPGITNQLKEESRDIVKYSKEDLKHMIINFREKLKLAKSRFNL